MLLYYATLQKSVSQIRKQGIRPKRFRDNGKLSNNMVELFYDKDNAARKLLGNEKIVVLAVDNSNLNPAYIFSNSDDDNFITANSIMYNNIITHDKIMVLDFKTKVVKHLDKVTKLNHDYYY